MPKNEFICDCHAINTEAVERCKNKMPSEDIIKSITKFFSIIGDGTRCKILFALKESEMCVCDLSNVLSMTKSSVSHQLKKLKAAGAVKHRREGRQVFYSLDDSHVFEIFEVALLHISHKAGEIRNEK